MIEFHQLIYYTIDIISISIYTYGYMYHIYNIYDIYNNNIYHIYIIL